MHATDSGTSRSTERNQRRTGKKIQYFLTQAVVAGKIKTNRANKLKETK